jgi:hypothetical protein
LLIEPRRGNVRPVFRQKALSALIAVSAVSIVSGCNGNDGTSASILADTDLSHIFTGVYVQIETNNSITGLKTTMTVPAEPPANGTLFLWPGLDPRTNGTNFMPINNGVLQPVLTWGPSCAPTNAPTVYSTWWISGQYVNTNGSESGFTGCLSGNAMPVSVGDTLNIDMSLSGTTWTQTITDAQTGQSVDFSIDLQGQAQNLAYFQIEGYDQNPVADVDFTNTVITFANPQPDCEIHHYGSPAQLVDQNDQLSSPVLSNGNTTCSISQIVLHDPEKPLQPGESPNALLINLPTVFRVD